MKRRSLFAILMTPLLSSLAYARGGPRGDDPQRSEWFAKQTNMMGGSCCLLGDAHGLDPGDVKFDPSQITDDYNGNTGWFVRLPDPRIRTFGRDLSGEGLPKIWVPITKLNMRNPNGGVPPVPDPLVWYDVYDGQYRVYCFEPNPQL